jgi:NodT family efflux transporter outer membrane factor (OMF) lipoprotein
MVTHRALFVMGGLVALGGCAPVGPDYALPDHALVSAPAAQGTFVSDGDEVSRTAPPDHWWKLYDDPRLDGLIEKALAGNTDLRVAEANLERSDALLEEVRTGSDFSALADAETSYVQQSAEQSLSHVKPPERPIYNLGVGISYDLDLFGGIRRGIEAASDDKEAIVAARDLARVNVAAETARAYSDICNAGNELAVLRHTIAIQEQSLALTRSLIANGRAPAFERDRQQGLIDNTRAQLAPISARQENAAFRMAVLMGQPPEQYDRTLLGCHAPLKLRALLPTGDGQAMLRRRPDVRAAERRLAAATARIGVATAALYPDIKFVATVGSTGAGADFLSGLTNRFGVGPAIAWNLDQRPIRARIAEAEAGARASLAAFDGVVLTALRETESSLTTYSASLARLKRLEVARDDESRVAARTEELRRGGRVDGLTALDAERTWTIAEAAVAAAQHEINADQMTVFLALGGGWQ